MEAEIRERITQLTEARQVLSLDALTDDAARDQLSACELSLSGARAEIERVGLPRQEARKREQAGGGKPLLLLICAGRSG